jgi:hypothetical protein
LPKLAVQGLKVSPDPSCHIFFSQLTLTDKFLIQRENEFIQAVKKILVPESGPQELALFDLLKRMAL